jgi:nitrous oxide reductase accessory protein NosL
MTRRILLALALVTVLLAGCEKAVEPFRDAPRGATNTSPADLITMPDGFSNVAAKCDGPNRVYVVFHGDSAAVAPNDPRCGGSR